MCSVFAKRVVADEAVFSRCRFVFWRRGWRWRFRLARGGRGSGMVFAAVGIYLHGISFHISRDVGGEVSRDVLAPSSCRIIFIGVSLSLVCRSILPGFPVVHFLLP